MSRALEVAAQRGIDVTLVSRIGHLMQPEEGREGSELEKDHGRESVTAHLKRQLRKWR